MFAPNFHQAMKHAITPRRELGIRTVFNVLGPLTNPAGVKGQVLGVFDPDLTEIIANTLMQIGVVRALVVHGMDGLDEITTTSKTKVSELKNGQVTTYYLDPKSYGFSYTSQEEILGGEPRDNAEIIMSILNGEKGPKRDITILNSAAAIYVANIAQSLDEGIKISNETIDSGLALKKLKMLINLTQEMKK